MKKILLLLGLGTVIGLSPLAAQTDVDYAALFQAQLRTTCSGTILWEKSVTELSEGGTETRHFRIDCAAAHVIDPDDNSPTTLPTEEFSYLFAYLSTNPRIAPLMQITHNAGGIQATLKPEHAGETPLQKQNFERDANGLLRYAESTVRKQNTLYDLEVNVRVWFDDKGRYERHETTTSSDVLFGGEVKTLIKGKILP
jgi:hypothetical protein